MVDSAAFWKPGQGLNFQLEKYMGTDVPDDEFLLLLPPTLPGYNFQIGEWVELSVTSIGPIDWRKGALECLAVDPAMQALLSAFVANNFNSSANRNANGIGSTNFRPIILFHGDPGTGKTLAAECVAETAQKPLLRINIAGIGSSPLEMEKLLREKLEMGNRWDCILLIDEADNLLQKRSLDDMDRNALVTSFLRLIDSYPPCTLILTSSRVSTLDATFRSRIHLAVHFKPFNKEQRESIWRMTVLRAKLMKAEEDDLLEHIDELAKSDANGRVISNSILGAQQLAKYKKTPLDYSILKQVMASAEEFDQYMSSLSYVAHSRQT